MLTHEDKELLAKKGITEKQIEEQLACFEKGFPYLQLAAAASVDNNGIMIADADAQKKYLAAWDAYKDSDKKIVKFVPASGAASRMFKTCSNSWVLIMTCLLQVLKRNFSIIFIVLLFIMI